MTTYTCANCGIAATTAGMQPRGWERYTVGGVHFWCGVCVNQLIDGVIEGMQTAVPHQRFGRRRPSDGAADPPSR